MRQSKSMRAKGYTDARAFPGGVAILPSRNKHALRNKAGCVRFLLAQLILLPSLKHTLGTKVGKKCIDNFIFSQTGSKLFSLTQFSIISTVRPSTSAAFLVLLLRYKR